MIKKFFTSSIVYAGSALLFSFMRQIVFFPLLHRISPDLFVEISFLIILVDFIIYSFGASLADYYVKNVVKTNKQLGMYKFLHYVSFLSLFSFILFFYYKMNPVTSTILSFYILFYTFNTLQMKLFFNDLRFGKNYTYIFLRLSPYIILLLYEKFWGFNALSLFAAMLLLFEVFAYYLFKYELKTLYKDISNTSISIEKNIVKFICIYLLFALVLRLDMFVIQHLFPEFFSEYYQMISVYMIFVNPIILITSASLLSILTHIRIETFAKYNIKIISIILGISFISGLLFQFFGKYFIDFLYPHNKLIETYHYLSFLVIFTTLSFQMSKTFVIKYHSLNSIIFANLTIIIVPFLFISNFLYFLLSFFIIRGMMFVIQFLLIGRNHGQHY